MPSMALKDRIQELLDAGFKKGVLAKSAGKSPAAVTHWLNGETKEIKADSAAGLQALTGYSSIWISEGKGPKHSAQSGSNPADYKQKKPIAGEFIDSVAIDINVNRRAPPTAQEMVANLSEFLAGVEPGRMGTVIAALADLARNPNDEVLRDSLARMMAPAAFTLQDQRTG